MRREKIFVPLILILALLVGGCYTEGEIYITPSPEETVDLWAAPSGDGYLYLADHTVVQGDGVYVEEGYTEGYLSFSITSIPSWAWIKEAVLFLGVSAVYPDYSSVALDIERVEFPLPLDPSDYYSPSWGGWTVRIYPADEGNYVALDVTDLVRDAFLGGRPTFQVRLNASGGAVDLEDGEGSLGGYLVPFLEVTYY